MGAKRAMVRYGTRGVVGHGAGEYMAIVTIGQGTPPAVKVDDTGLEARIAVGTRTVRFDSIRIILEQRERTPWR